MYIVTLTQDDFSEAMGVVAATEQALQAAKDLDLVPTGPIYRSRAVKDTNYYEISIYFADLVAAQDFVCEFLTEPTEGDLDVYIKEI